MPLNIPASNPLTPTQSELTAKIGSMKSLLSLPFIEFKNIPKGKQVSTFDYLMRIFTSLGISPQVMFQQFFSRIFDGAGSIMETAVVEGVASQVTAMGIKLGSPGENFSIVETNAEEQAQINTNNTAYLKQKMQSAGLSNFLQTAKQQIIKDLTIAVFGPKTGPAAEYLNPNPAERERIVNNAVCASDAFSMSNNAFIRDEDVEYNRIALARQLEKGEVIFEISCQEVKVTLPEDPSYIFEGGGQQTIEGGGVTPSQSVTLLANFVESTAQAINNQQNSTSAGKSFWQILTEKFISNATNLVFPFVGPLVDVVQDSMPEGQSITAGDLITSTCDILNETSPNPQQKKKFGEELANKMFKILLQIMIVIAIREFKKLVRNYFARIARERAKRKLEKIKARFNLAAIEGAAEDARKAAAFAKATASLATIIGGQTPI